VSGAAKALHRRTSEVVGRLVSGETCADHAHRIETPRFFLGISGAGYTLLRLANPKSTPSILMFEHDGRSTAR
jgi:lantibiotic modifying enzyme